jgi:hypothetical protein
MRAPGQRLSIGILMAAGAIAAMALGSEILRRRFRPEPPPLGESFEVLPVVLERAWGRVL